jgi:hypothetical protein
MLPRLRASAKKAIGLLERRVSSSKQSLKQVNLHVEILKNHLESNIYFLSATNYLVSIDFSLSDACSIKQKLSSYIHKIEISI